MSTTQATLKERNEIISQTTPKNMPTFINTTDNSIVQQHKPNNIGQNKKGIIINAKSSSQDKNNVNIDITSPSQDSDKNAILFPKQFLKNKEKILLVFLLQRKDALGLRLTTTKTPKLLQHQKTKKDNNANVKLVLRNEKKVDTYRHYTD